MKTTVSRMLGAYLRRFEPSGIPDPEVRRTGTIALLLTPAFGLLVPVFLALYVYLEVWVAAAAIACGAVFLVALPFVYQRTGSVRLLVFLMASGLASSGTLISAVTGGIHAPALQWLTCFPLVAMLLLGLRAASVWLLVLVLIGWGFCALPLLGIELVNQLSPEEHTLVWLVSFPGVATSLMLVGWGFERSKRDMVARVEAAHAEAVKAHRDVRLVLDHVHQGLILVDRRGTLLGECSAFASKILGPLQAGTPVWQVFERVHPPLSQWLRLVWPTLSDPLACFELAVEPIPKRIQLGIRAFDLRFHPILEDGTFAGAVLDFVDVSAAVEAAKAQREQRELHKLATHVVRDPSGMRGFLEEGRQLIATLRLPSVEPTKVLRALHTLKGNAAMFGLERLGELCHRLESQRLEGELAQEDLGLLASAWSEVESRVSSMLGTDLPEISVSRQELETLLSVIDAGRPMEVVRSMVESWTLEPVAPRLARLAAHARTLAGRTGKGPLEVELEHGGVRMSEARYGPLWSALIHVVRNAVDHGLEPTLARVRAGKPRRGRLRFEAGRTEDGGLRLAFSDDGAGIDWPVLRKRAEALGVECEGREAELLFRDGLSSQARVGRTSGRGVGLAAVKQAVEALQGRIQVQSALGEGTTFEILLPPEQPSHPAPGAERRPHAE